MILNKKLEKEINMSKDEKGNVETAVFEKGTTFKTLTAKFAGKLDQEKQKAFEAKFGAKYKELDNANAIVRGIEKELEKLYVEYSEGL